MGLFSRKKVRSNFSDQHEVLLAEAIAIQNKLCPRTGFSNISKAYQKQER